MNLSTVVTNDLFQPWRAFLTIINLCLTGKTSGFERPRAPLLQILWGIVTGANIDYAKRIWEEFTQSIHTFIEDKRNQHTLGKKRAPLIVIPSVRFTKLIIHHLQRKHRFHPRPDSPLHLSNEEPILGYLNVSRKTRQSKSSPKSVGESEAEEVPVEEPQIADEDADFQKTVEESMKDAYALPKGPLPPVVIREPESGKYQPLPEVPGKGKAKVSEERVSEPTASSFHDVSPYEVLGQSDSEDESEKIVLGVKKGGQDEGQARPDPNAQAEGQTGLDTGAQAKGQAGSNPDETSEGQAGSNPDETSEGQAGPDPGNAEARVQSTSSPVIHAGSDLNKTMKERLDKHRARLYTLEQLDIPHQLSIAVSEVVMDAVDWAMQAPLRNRFGDLPEADMKEILHQRMWETDSYKSHEVHMQLFEALEKSINRWWKPFEEERPTTLEPAWSIRTSDTSDITTFMDWFCKQRGITELKPQDLEGPAYEIVKVFHPDVIHLQYQMEECHKLLTDSVDDPILRHNVSKPLPLGRRRPHTKTQRQQTTTTGGPPGQVTIQSDFFFNKDLEYLIYDSKGRRPALTISKMKATYYLDAGLEQIVPDQFWIEEECKYDIAAIKVRTHIRILSVVRIEVFSMYGQLVIRQCVEDFQLGIESYQTQVNLTKPQWTATGFEYKHDYTVIESPRAVIFRDKYGVQMMMRFNEIHKFSDGTLQQIVEALDYRVKEFRINMMNPGLNTRFWTRKDVDRCNAFMFAIQRRLRTQRIFRNLESFVGGRVREGDYILLKRTD
nr:hypothetical protein [Tanacetum cinerariifolium]